MKRMRPELVAETEIEAPPGAVAVHAAAIPVPNAMWESARWASLFWTGAKATAVAAVVTRASDVAGKLLVAADIRHVAKSAAWVFHYLPQAAVAVVIAIAAAAKVWANWALATSTAPHSPVPGSGENVHRCHK